MACGKRGAVVIGGRDGMAGLGSRPVGFAGRITAISAAPSEHGISSIELERRLIEMGFVEGAHVRILHQGLFGADPIAVRIGSATVALRRAEAQAIQTEPVVTSPVAPLPANASV